MAATPNPPKRSRKRRRPLVLTIIAAIFKTLGTLLLIGVVTSVILVCFAATYIKTVVIPQAHLAGNFDLNLTSTIYYTDPDTGEYVEHLSLHGSENREMVEFSEIPKDLINATVAIEDNTFWTHKGVNWKRTLYGVLLMFTGQDIQGGSTITQQLIKNSTQYDDVTVKRKILEIFTALDFDASHSKEQIITQYLNLIYLGDGCYGVAAAAKNYFGKELSELSLAECASLIGITNNPTLYGPYSIIRITDEETGKVTTGLERNKQRQELILYEMYRQEIISEAEYRAAVKEELVFTRSTDEERPAVIYNWYDEQVITDVINDLMDKYGYSSKLASDMVTSGGLKIYACVDTKIQALVEQVYSDRDNLPLVSDSGQKIQSAIVIVDPLGNVVGLAGAMGEKEENRGWNYASRSTRQPGSSIKPLTVYAPALEMGLITPASVYDDYPVQLLNGNAWPPNAYSGFRGLMTIREAVKISSNTVATRVFQEVTPTLSFQFAEDKFHIDLEDGREVNGEIKSDLGPAQLALGGLTDGVRVIDMAAAYSVFPRDGVYLSPRTYTKVTQEVNGQEIVLLDNTTNRNGEIVLKSSTVWYINDMLTDVVQTGTATRAKIPGQVVAGKTGTTNSYNDRWFVGYTSYYTAAVWVGYDNPERIPITGDNNPPVVMWQKVMSLVHEGLESKDFPQPNNLVSIQYCLDSGMRATEACMNDPRGSRVGTAWVIQGDGPVETCTMHVPVEVCTSSSDENVPYHLAGEFCPREPIEGVVEVPTVKTISLLDYDREIIGGKTANDSAYLMNYVESLGTCPVHTELIEPVPAEYDPNLFDIADPSTWPTQEQWPGFDPANELTWPIIPPPAVTESPSVSPWIDLPSDEQPTPTPLPDTGIDLPPPSDTEPYIPADVPEQ